MQRECELKDSGSICEMLIDLDEQRRSMTYTMVKSTWPVENYLATVRVMGNGKNQSRVEWQVVYAPKGIGEDHVKRLMQSAFTEAIDRLDALDYSQWTKRDSV